MLGVSDVDVVTCCDVIEHLLEPLHAMKQAHAILKRSGWIFLSTPNLSSWRRIRDMASGRHPRTSGDDCMLDGGHIGYYGALDLVPLLEAAGFCGVNVLYRNPDPVPMQLAGALQQLGGLAWLGYTYQIAVARK